MRVKYYERGAIAGVLTPAATAQEEIKKALSILKLFKIVAALHCSSSIIHLQWYFHRELKAVPSKTKTEESKGIESIEHRVTKPDQMERSVGNYYVKRTCI